MAAHCVNIAERVDRRHAAINLGIVSHGREKIDRLDQRKVVRKTKNARVVGILKTDDHIFGWL